MINEGVVDHVELTNRILNGSASADDLVTFEDSIVCVGIHGANSECVALVRNGDSHMHQLLLGLMERHGYGTPRDMHAASMRFLFLHEKGCALGTYEYACHLLFDTTTPEHEVIDLLESVYRRAPHCLRIGNLLGKCYDYGWGGVGNLEKAIAYYESAARGGFTEAMLNLIPCLLSENMSIRAAYWCRRVCSVKPVFAFQYLEAMRINDPESVNPYGDWLPTKKVHQWVSKKVRQEMITALLVCKRFGIPRNVAVHCLLPFICSLPH